MNVQPIISPSYWDGHESMTLKYYIKPRVITSLMDVYVIKIDRRLPTPFENGAEWGDEQIRVYQALQHMSEGLLQKLATRKLELVLERPAPGQGLSNSFPTPSVFALQQIRLLRHFVNRAVRDITWALVEIEAEPDWDRDHLRRTQAKSHVIVLNRQGLPEGVKPNIIIKTRAPDTEPGTSRDGNHKVDLCQYRYLIPLTTSGHSSTDLWLDLAEAFPKAEDLTIEVYKLYWNQELNDIIHPAIRYLPEYPKGASPALAGFFAAGTLLAPHEKGMSYRITTGYDELLSDEGLIRDGRLRHLEDIDLKDFLLARSRNR